MMGARKPDTIGVNVNYQSSSLCFGTVLLCPLLVTCIVILCDISVQKLLEQGLLYEYKKDDFTNSFLDLRSAF